MLKSVFQVSRKSSFLGTEVEFLGSGNYNMDFEFFRAWGLGFMTDWGL